MDGCNKFSRCVDDWDEWRWMKLRQELIINSGDENDQDDGDDFDEDADGSI